MMRQRLTVLAMAGLLLTSPVLAQFNFSDFSGAGGSLYLNGNAAIVGSALRLVPADYFKSGSAYYISRQPLNLSGGWTTTFRFQITNLGDGFDLYNDPGADGFAFIIQDSSPSALGSAGGGLGYAGIPRSLAVEFDTWYNTEFEFGDDFNSNHVAVHTRWQNPNSAYATARLGVANVPFDLEDGQVHTATIAYNGSGQLSITLDGVSTLTVNFAHSDYLSILNSGSAWVGFTAATGGTWENIDILSWSFTPVPEPASCVALGAGLAALALRRRKRA